MISLSHVTYRYPHASTPVVCDVSLCIPDGARVCIIGGCASGKSTLARILNGSFIPQTGTCIVDGIQTSSSDRFTIARYVGMVRQDPHMQIVGETVEDEVGFGPKNMGCSQNEITERVTEALAYTGISHLAQERVAHLSGGQIQLCAIAGILAMRSKYLVFDEVKAQLDKSMREQIQTVMQGCIDKGHTIIEISHDPQDIFYADIIVVMKEGQVSWSGSLHEFLISKQAQKDACMNNNLLIRLNNLLLQADSLAQPTSHPQKLVEELSCVDCLHQAIKAIENEYGYTKVASDKCVLMSARNVTYTYGAEAGIHDVSVVGSSSRCIALIGASGSGKTTLAKVLCGLETPHIGTVEYEGESITPGMVGYMFQRSEDQFFCPTVYDEIAFSAVQKGMASHQAYKLAQTLMNRLSIPADYGQINPYHLSGGYKRLCAFASTQTLGSKAFILDEPTCAMDGLFIERLRSYVKTMARHAGCLFMVITHDLDEWMSCIDEVIIVQNGRIQARLNRTEALYVPERYLEFETQPPFVTTFLSHAKRLGGDVHVQ